MKKGTFSVLMLLSNSIATLQLFKDNFSNNSVHNHFPTIYKQKINLTFLNLFFLGTHPALYVVSIHAKNFIVLESC